MATSVLISDPLSTIAYLLLMTAITSLWISPKPIIWASLGVGATFIALLAHRITITGIVALTILCFTCFAFYRLKPRNWLKILSGFFLFISALAVGAHKVPGFNNWPILSDFFEQANILRAFCIANHLPSVKFHTLRACFATQLISTGIPATVVMKICGWQDLKTMHCKS